MLAIKLNNFQSLLVENQIKRKELILNYKMDKILKKIIAFLSIYILTTTSTIYANTFDNEIVNFYRNKTITEVCYDGNPLEMHITRASGSKYDIPIYSCTHEKNPIGKEGYSTKVEETFQNNKVRNALVQGFPNRGFDEIGCENEEEAYIVTQLAIWDDYYHYDLEKFTVPEENSYPEIVEKIKQFIGQIRSSSEEKIVPNMEIVPISNDWTYENEQMSKTYQFICDQTFNYYTVEAFIINDPDNPQKVPIRNENGDERSIFWKKENFEITIPSQSFNKLQINLSAEFETYPVKKGEEPSKNDETYVFLDETEIISTSLTEENKNGNLDFPLGPGDHNSDDNLPSTPEEDGEKTPQTEDDNDKSPNTPSTPDGSNDNPPTSPNETEEDNNSPGTPPKSDEDDTNSPSKSDENNTNPQNNPPKTEEENKSPSTPSKSDENDTNSPTKPDKNNPNLPTNPPKTEEENKSPSTPSKSDENDTNSPTKPDKNNPNLPTNPPKTEENKNSSTPPKTNEENTKTPESSKKTDKTSTNSQTVKEKDKTSTTNSKNKESTTNIKTEKKNNNSTTNNKTKTSNKSKNNSANQKKTANKKVKAKKLPRTGF